MKGVYKPRREEHSRVQYCLQAGARVGNKWGIGKEEQEHRLLLF